jgi:hypothetical protein
MGLFFDDGGFADYAKDSLYGGASAGAGRYIYEKVLADPINNLVGKNFGKYSEIASAFGFSLAVNYLAKGQSGMLKTAASVAGYTPIGDAIGVYLGDAPSGRSAPSVPSVKGMGYGGLQPIPLNRGSGGTTSVR